MNSPQITGGVLPYETKVTQKEFSFLEHDTSLIAMLWDLDSDKALDVPLPTTGSNSSLFHLFPPPFPTNLPLSLTPSLLSLSMSPRSLGKNGSQMHSTFLTRIIGYYPAMMFRPETFPPFVYALYFSESRDNGTPSEALVNCMSVAQLFVNRTKETKKFLWGTVRMEQERMWREVRSCRYPFTGIDVLISFSVHGI
jgi:hypothetical protein